MRISGRVTRASAPTRVDLAGGTLDIWPLYLLVDAAVTVSAAVELRAHAAAGAAPEGQLRASAEDLSLEWESRAELGRAPAPAPGPLPLHEAILRQCAPSGGVTLLTRGEVPAGSGLGGSSALAIAMLGALAAHRGYPLDGDRLAALARDLEAKVLGIPTGTQDHLAALHGGISAIAYGPGGPTRREIPLPARELEDRGVLVFLGASRASARANWDMVRRAVDGDPATRRGLTAIAEIAGRLARAIERGDVDACGKLLGEEWNERRGLSPTVSTPATESAIEAAMKAGAHGAKICGAGGGGCLFVMGPPGVREGIGRALTARGCTRLEFRIASRGFLLDGPEA